MKALVAFDKFKGSLSAEEACRIAAQALDDISPDFGGEEAPLTDGGEGFATLLTAAADGEIRRCSVHGPLGDPLEATWGLVSIEKLLPPVRDLLKLPVKGEIAIVEMAKASGLQLLEQEEQNPWRTTTRGTGELLKDAAASHPAAILLGIGGSATHDLGLGALQALGLRGRARAGGAENSSLDTLAPEQWDKLEDFSGSVEPGLAPIIIASDVDNPLLGERGAAKTFAPQKGLRREDLDRLEDLTARVAERLCQHFGQDKKILAAPGSGAAGGIGCGLRIACGARIISGFSLVRAWMDLDRKLAEADLVLTGEGSFDASSLEGKAPGAVVKKAAAAGKNCLVLAGKIDLPDAAKREYPSCRFIEISPRDWPLERVLAEGAQLLEQAVKEGVKGMASS